jgi:hypothetical protein
MNTALRIHASQSRTAGRVPLLAAASALVAAGSIAVTLAVAGGGGEAENAPGAQTPQAQQEIDGKRSAERFHHFR